MIMKEQATILFFEVNMKNGEKIVMLEEKILIMKKLSLMSFREVMVKCLKFVILMEVLLLFLKVIFIFISKLFYELCSL